MINLQSMKLNNCTVSICRIVGSLVVVGLISACGAKSSTAPTSEILGVPGSIPRQFDSPEIAAKGLLAAATAGSVKEMEAIFGPENSELYSSGDEVADVATRRMIVDRFAEGQRIESKDARTSTLILGKLDWPFPVPVVQGDNGKWYFDGSEGVEEVVNRRIGKNELSAIEVCREIADAQKDYYELDPDGDGVKHYAEKVWSSPGKRDGLFWSRQPGEAPSPIGPLLATAAAEGYSRGEKPKPYHGYYFKFATEKSAKARGANRFRLVASPASWGVSGIMTFVANDRGELWQKNLGPDTAKMASELNFTRLNKGWEKVGESAQ